MGERLAQSNNRRETISLGTADLYLGKTEDAAIKKLAKSGYSPRKGAAHPDYMAGLFQQLQPKDKQQRRRSE